MADFNPPTWAYVLLGVLLVLFIPIWILKLPPFKLAAHWNQRIEQTNLKPVDTLHKDCRDMKFRTWEDVPVPPHPQAYGEVPPPNPSRNEERKRSDVDIPMEPIVGTAGPSGQTPTDTTDATEAAVQASGGSGSQSNNQGEDPDEIQEASSGVGESKVIHSGDHYDRESNLQAIREHFAPVRQFPFVAAVGYRFTGPGWFARPTHSRNDGESATTHCTGIIVGADWIITAGHCVRHYGMEYYITAGVDCRPENGGVLQPAVQVRKVRKVHFFKTYWRIGWSARFKHFSTVTQGLKGNRADSFSWSKYDIALIKLEDPLIWSETVQPISVAEPGESLDMETLHVAGWGLVESASSGRGGNGFFVDRPKRQEVKTTLLRAMKFETTPVPDADITAKEVLGDDCQEQLMCVKIQRDHPRPMRGDSGAPYVAQISGTDEKSLSNWRVVAMHEGDSGQDEPPDEMEEGTHEGMYNELSIFYVLGVRLDYQEKADWIKNVINR